MSGTLLGNTAMSRSKLVAPPYANDLTVSGLLYEGNFGQWLDRMKRVLQVCSPGSSITPTNNFLHNRPGNEETVRRAAPADCANLMWWHVSPEIRARIRGMPHELASVRFLMNVLLPVACPFRFLNLPKEVRQRIYSMVIHSATNTCTTLLIGSRSSSKHRNTANDLSILGVIQRICAETLSVARESKRFCLRWVTYPSKYSQLLDGNHGLVGKERVETINEWASCLKPDSIRMLRRVAFQHLREGAPGFGTLHFSMKIIAPGRFEVRCAKHAWLRADSQKLLIDHAAAVSNAAGSLDLEGEMLILVLTSRPEIWDQLKTVYQ